MEVVNVDRLSLKKVKIEGNVIGKFGTFEIEQLFINDSKDVLEVEYTFPIIETATVVGFEVDVGEEYLKGVCKEKTKAKKEYTKNIVKGNSAYMMEEESENIFKVSLGKVDRGETVKVKIKYIDNFEIIDNKIEIIIPTLVTPRYKSKITSKLNYGKVDYTVDFNINIDKTLNYKSIESQSHKMNIVEDEDCTKVEIKNYDMSRDCKINIELKNESVSNAVMSNTSDNNKILYMSFMPEILDRYEDEEKEYLFLVDVSGSMEGEKLEQTKEAVIQCLRQLDNGDKFNIIAFESEFRAMNISSIEYNDENLDKAIKYIKSLKSLGGTEILNPLKFALYEKDTSKIILLFTDGQVGNEAQIINYVQNNINNSRIFPFGIDFNVNAYFIRELAKVGNGKAELIKPKERIDDKIIRTFARIQTPLLEEIKIDYGQNKLIDEIRENTTLFNYEYYNVFAKIDDLKDDIKLKGKILNKAYVWVINKENIKDSRADLELLFEKQEIERLEEYIRKSDDIEKIENYKKMIIEISEKYNINSKYTTFLTVYERNNKILEVPKYEQTTLSDKVLKTGRGRVLNKVWDMFSSLGADQAFEYDEYDEDEDYDVSEYAEYRKDSLDTSSFIRRDNNICNREYLGVSWLDEKYNLPEDSIVENKIKEYFNEFIKQEDKSILTYLLFAIYYLEGNECQFSYNDFIRFLKKNKEEVLNNDLYQKLLCVCYKDISKNMIIDIKNTLEFLNEDYIKALSTNLDLSIDLEKISNKEFNDIINKDLVKENIDKILVKLCWSIDKEYRF